MAPGKAAVMLLLVVLVASVRAFPEQSYCTFGPIAPGHLHNDRFSVLNNDRTEVTSFVAPNLAAGVLDFRSLEAGETVTLGLAGGIVFDSETIGFVSGGAETFSSGTSLDINALLGSVNFVGSGDFSATASGGDMDIDSQDGNVNLLAENGQISVEGAQVFFDGKYETFGVEFTTSDGGDISLRAGELEEGETGFGNIDIKGSDVTMASSLLTIQSIESDLSVSTQGTQIFAGESASIGASDNIDITSDLSDVLIDSGANTDISGTNVDVTASNRVIGRSIHDSVRVSTSGDIDLFGNDHTEFFATGDSVVARDETDCFGATLLAGNNIDVTAVQYVDLVAIGSGGISVTATDFDISSTRGNVVIGNEETAIISVASASNTNFDSSDDIKMHSLASTLLRSANGDVNFEVSNQAAFSAVKTLDVSGDTVNFNFDSFFGEFSGAAVMFGEGVVITTDNFVVSAGGNVDITVEDTATFTFVDEFQSIAHNALTWEAETISATVADDLTIDSDGNAFLVATNDGSTVAMNTVGNFDVDGLRGSHELKGGAVSFTSAAQSPSVDSSFVAHGNFRHESDRDISISAVGDVNVHSDEEMIITNDQFTSLSTSSTDISADFGVRIDAQDTVTFASGSTGTTSIDFSADGDFSVSGGEHYTFTGTNVEIDASDIHFFARDEFNVNAVVQLEIDAEEPVALESASYVAVTGNDLNWNADMDVNLFADPRAGGEVRIRSETSSVTLQAENGEFIGAQHIVSGATVGMNAGNNFAIDHEGPLGDVIFNAGGSMAYSADLLEIDGSEVDLQSVGDVSIASQISDLQITTANEHTFTAQAEDGVNMLAVDIAFTDDFITIDYTVGADIAAGDDLTISSDDGVFFNADGDINADYSGDIALTTNTDDVTINADGDISLIGASIDIDGSNSVSMISGGGGHVFTAGTDISFSGVGSSFTSDVTDANTFVAQGGDIEATSSAGTLTLSGGNSTYSAGGDIFIASADTLNTATSRPDTLTLQLSPGNILYSAGEDYIEEVEGTWSVVSSGPMYPTNNANNNPSNYGDGAGNGSIATTAEDSDICLFTLPVDEGDSARFTFSAAESMLVSAFGSDGHLDLFADGGMTIQSQQHSIGLSAFGSTTDPEFLITDSFGILLRASRDEDNGDVTVSSASDFNVFAQTSTDVEATEGSAAFTATDILTVRTSDLDAGINLRAQTGDLTFSFDDALVVAGTATTIGNINFNSTSTSMWNWDELFVTQLGANTNDIREGILFQAFGGDIDIAAPAGTFSTTTFQDGGLHMLTESGDALLNSGDELQLLAESGQVLLEGRTGGFLDTRNGGDEIQLAAGRNLEFVTAGEEQLSIAALDTKLFLTATAGEIDVQATTGLTVNAAATLDLDGPCINVIGGGSVEMLADEDISLSTSDEIRFDADVEMTVDAVTTFTVLSNEIILNAGGDESTTGVSVQATDAVAFTTPLDMRIDALATVMQADTTFDITAVNDVRFTSTSASGTNDNLLVHATDGNIDLNAGATVQMQGTEEHTISTNTDMDFIADSARLLSNRDVRVAVQNDMTVTAEDSITMNQAAGSWLSEENPMTFTPTTDFLVAADSILTIDAVEGVTVDAGNAMTFTTAGRAAPITFEANADALTLGAVAALTDVVVTVPGLVDIDGPEGIVVTSPLGTLTAAEDITVSTGEAVQLDATGAPFTVTTGSHAQFLATTGEISLSGDTLLSMDAPSFSATAYGDIDITADTTMTMTPSADSNLHFTVRDGDLEVDSATSAAFTSGAITFTTESGTVEITAETIDFAPTNDLSFATDAADIELNTQGLTITAPSAIFESSGLGGVSIAANNGGTLDIDAGRAVFSTEAGRIALSSAALTMDSASFIQHETTDTNGHIYFQGADIEYSAIDMSVGALVDTSNVFGHGVTRFESREGSVTVAVPTLDVRSEHDLRISGDVVTVSSANALNYQSTMSTTFTAGEGGLNFQSTTGAMAITTNGENSDMVLSSQEVTLTAATGDVWNAPDDIILYSSVFSDWDTSVATLNSAAAIYVKGGQDVLIEGVTVNIAQNGNQNGISFDSTNSGSTIDVESGALSFTSAGDMEFQSQHFIYSDADTLVSLAETEIISSNDVWMFGNSVSFTVTGTAVFGTQGSGNYNVDAATHTVSATDVTYESRGNLGGLGGRYVATNIYYNFVAHSQLDSISDNINGIEVHTVQSDLLIQAADDVFIESHGGSIEIRAQYDIHYDLSTATGQLGFYGVLETNGGAGVYQAIPFLRETDYCASNFGTDRCDPDINCSFASGCGGDGGTCTVTCAFTSGVINDIASMLVAYGLADCSGSTGFCCVLPNC